MRVALVAVGDEILAGDTVNTNAAWLGRRLAERGVDVERVTVVPDRVRDIARLVNEQRAEFDAVIVTGGVGPTHDDVTMEGVAAAFGRGLEPNEAALAWLEADEGYTSDDLADGTTDLPAGAEFVPNPEGVAPGCIVGNVYVLPGVPEEMKGMFAEIADDFAGTDRYVESLESTEPESALVDRLIETQERFDVTVGSYPGERVTLKIRSEDSEAVEAARQWLSERVERPE